MEDTLNTFCDNINSLYDQIEKVNKVMCQIVKDNGDKITIEPDEEKDITIDMYFNDGVSYECNIIELTVNNIGNYQSLHITGESVQYGTIIECELDELSLTDISIVAKFLSGYKK